MCTRAHQTSKSPSHFQLSVTPFCKTKVQRYHQSDCHICRPRSAKIDDAIARVQCSIANVDFLVRFSHQGYMFTSSSCRETFSMKQEVVKVLKENCKFMTLFCLQNLLVPSSTTHPATAVDRCPHHRRRERRCSATWCVQRQGLVLLTVIVRMFCHEDIIEFAPPKILYFPVVWNSFSHHLMTIEKSSIFDKPARERHYWSSHRLMMVLESQWNDNISFDVYIYIY